MRKQLTKQYFGPEKSIHYYIMRWMQARVPQTVATFLNFCRIVNKRMTSPEVLANSQNKVLGKCMTNGQEN